MTTRFAHVGTFFGTKLAGASMRTNACASGAASRRWLGLCSRSLAAAQVEGPPTARNIRPLPPERPERLASLRLVGFARLACSSNGPISATALRPRCSPRIQVKPLRTMRIANSSALTSRRKPRHPGRPPRRHSRAARPLPPRPRRVVNLTFGRASFGRQSTVTGFEVRRV
jgi:hypothetical protein